MAGALVQAVADLLPGADRHRLFIDDDDLVVDLGRSSITVHTADRSASPETVGGVPTATYTNSAPSIASTTSVVKVSRSRFRARSSSSPGS